MGRAVVEVRDLRKAYGQMEAVRGIDLEVAEGEIFAFLGPNGAGKTTTVEILEGYRGRDAGHVEVLGRDPAKAGRDWNARIGVMLQDGDLQPELTVRESLEQFAGYYARARDVDETLELVGLAGQADQRAGRLSGGQQRRLDLGLALVGDPELLFLDEPTTGFDPAARRGAWAIVERLRELGKTIFLTTHYMEEAQALADRVAIIAGGLVVADGTPDALTGPAATRITFRPPDGTDADEIARATGAAVELERGRMVIATAEPVRAVHAVAEWALARGVELPDLEVRRRSLEDVYLELTAGR